MPKFTQGPWHVEPLQSTQGADLAICAPANGWVVAVIQHDPDIQTVDEPDGDTVVFHPEDHGNAAIIAEAPAMVEALRKVLGAHGHWETEGIIEARAILERIESKPMRYCVDGLTHPDPDTAEYQGDGEFAPFVIFDIQAQRNLPGEYATRAEAEAALARIDGEGGQ